jgi:hypothetical protein
MFSFVLLLIGLFTFCYGMEALRAAAFSPVLLMLMVPLPDF